ncbi:hypothetical protein A2994_01260 [candidate division Kazan bacterium RIFCSPLOWO2_01_FULL_48_13]|uniref:Ribose-5-phosphate isomerase n=1 Tax=candidate division Kazan bacterium RIFCSPLOWO2_01_FULL_48_13 TaxID=1798539 RepID=A0A1F4PMS6_UNCK3|nr:MAG: hypothetical protein A2994_01260 [candidate division Kazan bacterium RIFCSPLOWO2_01_FULL_48_13]
MIYIGTDHRGFEMKATINRWLKGRGYEFEDVGAFDYDHGDDYADFAIEVAQKVARAPDKNMGIVLCGSGVGAEVAANKVKGVRCGLGFEADQVYAGRKDDNINVLALAADNVTEEEALKLVERFLETEFVESERYMRRIEKIARYEGAVFEKHSGR